MSVFPLVFLGMLMTPGNDERQDPRIHQNVADPHCRRQVFPSVTGPFSREPDPQAAVVKLHGDVTLCAGSATMRRVISAVSTRLPEILTSASFRPANIG